jgi:multiple sugar transport system substrate-binding protein
LKTVKQLGAIALVAAILSACAGQAGATQTSNSQAPGGSAQVGAFNWKAHSGETITLLADVMTWTTGLQKYLADFTALTGITVKVQSFAEDLYYDKMAQTVRGSAGTADVYQVPMDGTGYGQFLAGGMEPLTPYLNDPTKTSPDYDINDFPANFLANGMYPPGDPTAQAYAIPISFETYILFYNKDLVAKYLGGKVPATMDELTAAAQHVKDAGAASGVSGAVMRAVRSINMIDTFTGVIDDSWGDQATPLPYNVWFDGDWSKPRLSDPKICRGLTNYAKLVKSGPANALTLDWPDATTLFSQGKAAFYIDASVFGPMFEDPSQSTVASKVGYATLPPDGGPSISGYWEWGLAIPKNAKNKDAAWYLIQWATNKAMTAKIDVLRGGAPRLSAYSDPAYTGALNPEFLQIVNASMKTARSTVVFKDAWQNGSLAVLDGMLAIEQGKDPATACADANTALQQVMSK